MKKFCTLISSVSIALIAGGAASVASAGDASDVLASFEKTGEEVTCLRLSRVRDSDPLDDYGILFEERGGAMYLNELEGRCTGLERERRFIYRTPGAQICKGDIISVVDNFGNFRGGCSLGSFQKLTEIEKTES